jgi:hypothetical protein
LLYGWGYDEADLDLMAECFTGRCAQWTPGAMAEGREAIREFYEGTRRRRRDARQQTRHVISNLLIADASETEADVFCCLTLVVTEDGPLTGDRSSSVMGGRYRDRIVEDGDAWRFRERIINVDAEYRQRRSLRGGRRWGASCRAISHDRTRSPARGGTSASACSRSI